MYGYNSIRMNSYIKPFYNFHEIKSVVIYCLNCILFYITRYILTLSIYLLCCIIYIKKFKYNIPTCNIDFMMNLNIKCIIEFIIIAYLYNI